MVLHNPACQHVNRIGSINFTGFDRIVDAQKEGFRQCRCCDLMARRVNRHEGDIGSFCHEKHISYSVMDEELSIDTPFSHWKVFIGDKGNYDLYHRNTRGDITGYHLQRKNITDLMSILYYVEDHDRFRMANPLPEQCRKKKKSAHHKRTNKYKEMIRRAEKARKRDEVKRVLSMIDSLAMA